MNLLRYRRTPTASSVTSRGRRQKPSTAFWSGLVRARVSFLGLAIVIVLSLVALLGPFFAPYHPDSQQLVAKLQPPTGAHILGTDELGRDIFSRVLAGSRISMTAGVISVGIAVVLGVPLGLLSGYRGGLVDGLVMRLMDALLALPALVLALAITAALGPSLQNALIAIGIVATPRFARLTRGQTLGLRTREYVQAAKAIGAGEVRIVTRHILPNAAGPLIVQASLSAAFAILTEASLSFLGLGVQPPTASWGSMIKTGKDYLDIAPWMSLAPGAFICLAVIGFNFLGDAIRDALDPRTLLR